MRRVCIQFQPELARDAEEVILSAFRRALPDAEFVAGDDDGRYFNILFDAETPQDAMSRIATVFDHSDLGASARSSCIVACQGECGWTDYLLLPHFDDESADRIET
jgi:hypothetical protein